MQQISRAATASLLIALAAGTASAQSITGITATFDNSVPASNTTINNTNLNSIAVCWPTGAAGTCAGLGAAGLSGYTFERAGVPITPGGSPFSLGLFTHFNFPVSLAGAGPLTSVDLLLSYSIFGATPLTFGDTWTLTHEETPNTGTCAYPGGAKCADLVSFSLTSSAAPTPFQFGGSNYIVTLLGFGATADDGVLSPTFITFENAENPTQLWAQISQVPGEVVPEPATMTLLATGLVGLAASRRKKLAKKS